MTDREWTKETAAEALEVLKAHFGDRLHVERGNATFGSGHAKIQYVFAKVDDAGPLTPERTEFERYAQSYGLKPEHLGTEFATDGERYCISGLSTGSPKYPILAKRVRDGRTYKFTPLRVRTALGMRGLTA